MLFKASAPGSLMLLGEYAVLEGKQAVVCAIDKRMTVMLSPRTDSKIKLVSALGVLEIDLSELKSGCKIVPPFQFVLAALDAVKNNLKTGCDINIESEFSSTVGFASSAAVTAATLSVLSGWLHLSLSDLDLIKLGREVIQTVQGSGSGADIAACVMGGIVAYSNQPISAKKLPFLHPLTVIYSGSKTPTPKAIQYVANRFASYPQLFKQICQGIAQCAIDGIDAICQQDWPKLGTIMNVQQGLMDALGVNTSLLNGIIEQLRLQSSILGVKISGSGLGDCIVGLGMGSFDTGSFSPDVKQIPVAMTSRGVFYEKD